MDQWIITNFSTTSDVFWLKTFSRALILTRTTKLQSTSFMAYGYSKKNANFFKTSEDLHLIELRNSVKDCVDLVHNAIVTYEDFLIVDDNIEILQMRIFWNTWKDRRPIITINLQMRKLWKQTTSIQFRVYRIHTRVEAFYQSLWQRKLYDVFCFKSNRSFF